MSVTDVCAPLIRTPDQRLRVFVSSTLGELAPERAVARASIERLHLTPVMFELGARPHPPAELYRAYLDQSQVFLGIYWQRYGWVAPEEVVSGLEDEFRRSDGMPRLMYIKEPATVREDRLVEMIERLDTDAVSSYRVFTGPEELADLIENDLAILLTERFEAGSPEPVVVDSTPSRQAPAALAVPLTATIGRDAEVGSLTSLIRSGVRLVTVTGIGGVGKTRLASEATRELRDDFDDVHLVRIGDVVDPDLVPSTIASAIGVPIEHTQSPLDAVAAAIGEDLVLLTLDNLEQVIEARSDLAALLERCPRLHLLVTSRQVLGLRGEHEFLLAPFSVPEASPDTSGDVVDRLGAEPAVALFVEHAQAARPRFRLDASNAEAVAELCRRLDGLPLAIELVATRTRLLAPGDLLDRFGDRLHLVAGGADVPERQRTLEATLDWSHRMLTPREQALFAQLSVFSGGASLDAVEAVCDTDAVGEVVETLVSLLEKSLVVTVEDAAGGPRIGMLQTVRAYARGHLDASGELAAVRDRHADWYEAFARRCDPARVAGATARWASLDAELPNVRAAVAWRTECDDTAGLAVLGSSLWPWYWITGRVSEGRAWIGDLLERIGPPTEEPDDETTIRLCAAVGAARFSLGEHDVAESLLRRAFVGFDAVGDVAGAGQMACVFAGIGALDGECAEATALATRAVNTARDLGLDWGLAQALVVLGSLNRACGDRARGAMAHLEALDTARRVGEPILEGQILGQIAVAELGEGDLAAARRFLAEAADSWRSTRQMEGTARVLDIAAAIAFMEGTPRQAAVRVGAADAIRERLALPIWPARRVTHDEFTAALAESLGVHEYAAALTDGRAADPFALLPTTLDVR